MTPADRSVQAAAGRSLRDLDRTVLEQERRCERTTLLAHSRPAPPRGKTTRLTRTSGPMGSVVRVEPGQGNRWRVVVEYKTAELRHWVTEQLSLLQEAGQC